MVDFAYISRGVELMQCIRISTYLLSQLKISSSMFDFISKPSLLHMCRMFMAYFYLQVLNLPRNSCLACGPVIMRQCRAENGTKRRATDS